MSSGASSNYHHFFVVFDASTPIADFLLLWTLEGRACSVRIFSSRNLHVASPMISMHFPRQLAKPVC
jgi:hypothetical protein